jgi:hypothetical protein
VLGLRRRDALGSGNQGYYDARVWLRASYVAVLGLLDSRAADDVHSGEDNGPNSAGGAHPTGAGGTGPNGASRTDTNSASGTGPKTAHCYASDECLVREAPQPQGAGNGRERGGAVTITTGLAMIIPGRHGSLRSHRDRCAPSDFCWRLTNEIRWLRRFARQLIVLSSNSLVENFVVILIE